MVTIWTDAAVAQVRQIIGDVDDIKLATILALEPNMEEIEEAMLWFDGYGVPSTDGEWPLSGKVAAIFDILNADVEDETWLH